MVPGVVQACQNLCAFALDVEEARAKGKPFARNGCALFIEDIHLLVDTPEDIVESLNYHRINEIEHALYSHWHPDHTRGMRVFEQIKTDWAQASIGIKNDKPVKVFALPQVCEDIGNIHNKFGSCLNYYQNQWNVISLIPVESTIIIGDMQITFVPAVHYEECATVFVFEQEKSKVIYAPCDIKPFPIISCLRTVT